MGFGPSLAPSKVVPRDELCWKLFPIQLIPGFWDSSHRDALAAHPGSGPMDQQAPRVLPAAGMAGPGAGSAWEELQGAQEPGMGTGGIGIGAQGWGQLDGEGIPWEHPSLEPGNPSGSFPVVQP